MNKILEQGLSTESRQQARRGVSAVWQCPGFVSVGQLAVQPSESCTLMSQIRYLLPKVKRQDWKVKENGLCTNTDVE